MRGYTLLFLLGYVANSAAISCTDGAVDYNGKCYKLYSETKKNFADARATCASAPGGGDLVTIGTDSKQQFVRARMEIASVETMWLGVSLEKTDWRWVKSGTKLKYQGCFRDNNDARLNVFVSSSADNTPDSCISQCRMGNRKYAGVKFDKNDGSKIVCRCGDAYNPDVYQFLCDEKCPSDTTQKCGNYDKMRVYSVDNIPVSGWGYQQPNNLDGTQRCLALHKGYQYKYGDERCHGEESVYGYICEYDEQRNGCNARAGKCISIHSSSTSWFVARAECKKNGGDLIQVDTVEILAYLRDTESPPLDSNVDRWWIGGSRGNWQWPGGVTMIYTNWAAAQPENAHLCAIVDEYAGQGFKWDDKSCTETHYFMCQLGEVATTTTITTTTTKSTTTTTPTTTTPTPETTTTTTKTTTSPATTTTPPTTTTTKAKTTTTNGALTTTTTTTTTLKPTPSVTASESVEPEGTPTTTAGPDSGKQTDEDDDDKIFTTGVIIAITVAAVFVLLAFIRVMIYCCTGSGSSSKTSFDVDNNRQPSSFSTYNNPEFIMYDASKSMQSQIGDNNGGVPAESNRTTEDTTEALASQQDMKYSY